MEDISLKGKRILFIGQVLYDYHLKIKNELENQGAQVDFFENTIFSENLPNSSDSLLLKVKRFFKPNAKLKYERFLIEQISKNNYDVFFCIGGFSITNNLVNQIKILNPNVKTFLYLWDSFSVWPNQHLLELFDYSYSFDRKDCVNYNLTYLPLFYTDVVRDGHSKEIDLLYVGSVGLQSKNRLKILSKIKDITAKQGLTYYFHLMLMLNKDNLVNRLKVKIKTLLDVEFAKFLTEIANYRKELNFIHNYAIDSKTLGNLMAKSNCVIDIPVPSQFGLTIRTIEALAAGCKLITTNKEIAKEEFYRPEWIKIIEEENLIIDKDFLDIKPSHFLNINHLRLDNWLKKIIRNG